MTVRSQGQDKQITVTLFGVLRAAAGPLSLSVVIVMMTVFLAPVLVFAAQQEDDTLFICRPAIADETPADSAPPAHSCPCPGLCGIGGPAFSFETTGIPVPYPPVAMAVPVHRYDLVRIALRCGFRPFLRGPPEVFESL